MELDYLVSNQKLSKVSLVFSVIGIDDEIVSLETRVMSLRPGPGDGNLGAGRLSHREVPHPMRRRHDSLHDGVVGESGPGLGQQTHSVRLAWKEASDLVRGQAVVELPLSEVLVSGS